MRMFGHSFLDSLFANKLANKFVLEIIQKVMKIFMNTFGL